MPSDPLWTAKQDSISLPAQVGLPGLRHSIGLARWWHLGVDALWLLNGVIFFVLLFATARWERLVPTSWDVFPNALSVLIQYLSLDWPADNGWVAYNGLQDHQVHERAWVSILSGEAEITTTAGERIAGTPGLLVEFDPGERHAVRAVSDTRLLLLLTPWPGAGHPGPMSLPDKADAVAHAAEHAAEQRERSDASG